MKGSVTVKKYIVAGLFTIGVLLFVGFLMKGKITHEHFDSDRWKNWTETEADWSMRWDMMNSLRNNHELKGKTKNEIIELLGEPVLRTEEKFHYNLGMAKRGIDTGTLTIQFDESGKVIEFNVRRS
jgi:hypothetical protein